MERNNLEAIFNPIMFRLTSVCVCVCVCVCVFWIVATNTVSYVGCY